ncbi:unnamed protein product [Paramecium primaurelia]|uniref:ATPase ASNA1 homolog n=1 Tax=Paramecium primaurelia TaxID=5886 RepID=A0A8S1QAG2_PARPR|nr:unnamed protein product [Paramecium primaurelia]
MQQQVEPTLKNVLENSSLKWIFVGGKGGVGKTTTSSSLATLFAKNGKKTIIISTDPAHNLSDCFDQKIGSQPTQIKGIDNLSAMEIDPTVDPDKLKLPTLQGFMNDQATKSLLSELISSVPGIDEAMSFAELMNSVDEMKYDLIIFDTAPTGHTLRLLNFPNIMEKGLNKLVQLRYNFQNLASQFQGLFGSQEEFDQQMNQMFSKIETMKDTVTKVNAQMKDKNKTTFIGVCIPEFLSMYETERLVQELTKFKIDIHNIVINQVLFPDDQCKMCNARAKMQKKYLDQMLDLYDDFHVVIMPLQENEVRGIDGLKQFCELLLKPKSVPQF